MRPPAPPGKGETPPPRWRARWPHALSASPQQAVPCARPACHTAEQDELSSARAGDGWLNVHLSMPAASAQSRAHAKQVGLGSCRAGNGCHLACLSMPAACAHSTACMAQATASDAQQPRAPTPQSLCQLRDQAICLATHLERIHCVGGDMPHHTHQPKLSCADNPAQFKVLKLDRLP